MNDAIETDFLSDHLKSDLEDAIVLGGKVRTFTTLTAFSGALLPPPLWTLTLVFFGAAAVTGVLADRNAKKVDTKISAHLAKIASSKSPEEWLELQEQRANKLGLRASL